MPLGLSFIFPKDVFARFTASGSLTGSVTIPENNYCINNGFNKLSDCMLVMSNYATSVDAAKTYIESKGTPDFSKIAPTITYKEVIDTVENTTNGFSSTSSYYSYGDDYSFDSTTGLFKLVGNVNNTVLDDSKIGKYTCASTVNSSCQTIYKIEEYRIDTSEDGSVVYRLLKGERHTYQNIEALDSEIGLYMTEDDDGKSYYYRGAVKNNFVEYAGFIWRIIRRNGDGSIRLIYNGTSTSTTGNDVTIGNSKYNEKYYDPTYVGYKYSEEFELNDGETTANRNAKTVFSNMSQNIVYYYAKSYTKDDTTKKFKLSGDVVQKKWEADKAELISDDNEYKYTCFSTDKDATCNVVYKITGYSNSVGTYPQVIPISYSSKSYESILQNTTDSTIKTKLDTWYKTNIQDKTDSKGNSYASYIADEVFCNDRSIYSGSGYLLSPTTNFGAYGRNLLTKTPSLICSNDADKFSLSNTKAQLDYPVGLITVDEVAFGGGVYNLPNNGYYLYTGRNYWTISSSHFSSGSSLADMWRVHSSGLLGAWNYVASSTGVRPVLNLKADVTISGGDGSAINPYIIAD